MLKSIIKTTRPTQWLKNFVVLAALVFAGEIVNKDKSITALIAFSVFCLLSSGMYILNDLIDKEKDKQHPLKKFRPIAAGTINPSIAITVCIILILISLAAAWNINMPFFYFALSFVIFNLLYSTILKEIVIVDVMSIAVSFVIRAYAGAFAISVPASKWLIINTLLLALFLGFGKRRHEIILLEDAASNHRKILDKYSPYLLDQLIGVVTPAVVVMYMLYSFSPEVSNKLGTENLFLTVPFVVYGIFRYLYLIHQEEKGGSPTKVLITDYPILATVVLWILTVILVLYLL